jgi:hypothetical protein
LHTMQLFQSQIKKRKVQIDQVITTASFESLQIWFACFSLKWRTIFRKWEGKCFKKKVNKKVKRRRETKRERKSKKEQEKQIETERNREEQRETKRNRQENREKEGEREKT